MKWRVALICLVLAGAAGFILSGAGEPPAAATAVAASQSRAAQTGAPAVPAADWPPMLVDGSAREPKRLALLPLEPAEPAAYSMAMARENGDARAPPLQRDAPSDAASAAELADPKAYQQYETRQTMKLYAGFVRAAEADLPRLRDDIERGRQAGIAPEEIAKVEEKVRRIEAMRAQLLAENPGLAPAK